MALIIPSVCIGSLGKKTSCGFSKTTWTPGTSLKSPAIWKKEFFSKPSFLGLSCYHECFQAKVRHKSSSTPLAKVTLAWPILAAHQVGFPASACEGMLSMLLSHCFWWGWLAHVESIDILILCTFRWKNVASCVTFVFVCNQLALVQDSGPQSSIFKMWFHAGCFHAPGGS